MNEENKGIKPNGQKGQSVIMTLLVITLIISVFNQIQLFSIKSSGNNRGVTGLATGVSLASASEIIPKGVPDIYGKELGISYDDVSANNPRKADRTINVMGDLDRTITLTDDNLDGYVRITSQISCEYCCGAQSIIFTEADVEGMNKNIEAAIASGQIGKDQAEKYRRKAGEAACGCAHSYAMRGLAKYLITKHRNEFTDDEILTELAKWKTLFFPGIMQSKADVLKQKGIEFSYINLGSNKYRGIEKGASSSGEMVGGC